jgi:hypothetical protein
MLCHGSLWHRPSVSAYGPYGRLDCCALAGRSSENKVASYDDGQIPWG